MPESSERLKQFILWMSRHDQSKYYEDEEDMIKRHTGESEDIFIDIIGLYNGPYNG